MPLKKKGQSFEEQFYSLNLVIHKMTRSYTHLVRAVRRMPLVQNKTQSSSQQMAMKKRAWGLQLPPPPPPPEYRATIDLGHSP